MKEPSNFERHEQIPPEALLTIDNIAHIVRSRRRPEYPGRDTVENLSVEEQNATIHGRLGSGGSKEVYDIEIAGQHYALGICGIQDAPERMIEKWKIVLQEPANTQHLRERGFLVNELCDIRPTAVNGTPFPGIIMKRYQDLPFRVFDGKNVGRAGITIFNKDTQLNDEVMLEIMRPIIDEIVRLIQNGIQLGRDNFNLAESRGAVHLYFNDLGTMTVNEIPEDDFPGYIEYYTMWTRGALVNGVDHDTYEHNPYIHNLGNRGNSFAAKFEEAVKQRLTQLRSS